MKSEIRVATSNLRVIVPVTIISAMTIVVLALLFRAEFGLILVSVGVAIISIAGIAILGKAAAFYHASQVSKIEREKMQQELRIVKAQADRATLESYVLHFSKNERVIMSEAAPVRMIEAVIEPQGRIVDGKAQLLPAPINLLSALDNAARCLIVGVTNTGKTTLMKWIVWRRLQVGRVIVIDPHASPDKWPAGAEVVGRGRDYAAIDVKLQQLLALMDARYTEIGNGSVPEGHHSPLTILIDEWRAIVRALGDSASDAIRALLTESRKAAFGVFVASQSDRAKPLGLEGEYDLKDSFAVVRLALVDGQRTATLDTGNGEAPADLPGPFFPQGIPIPQGMESNEEESLILQLHEQGESLRAISQAVWGEGKFGAYWNDKIREVLDKFNVSSE